MSSSSHIAFSLLAMSGTVFFTILSKVASSRKTETGEGQGEDFISRLPDDVLILIITRNSSKEVVRTSILSKRWKNLYKYVSHFYFLCENFNRPSIFRRAIPHDSKITVSALHRFLQLHSGSKIQFFRLFCCLNKKDTHIFEQCIYSLGKLGIEQLNLQCSCLANKRISDLSFSLHLLSEMPSLKDLTLRDCFLQPSLKTQCNSLETLSLICVNMYPGALDCILSNCSSLHSLELSGCKFPSEKLCIHGQDLQLKSLMIDRCIGVEEIKICASYLVTFEFQNPVMVNILFDYVPQLQNFYLDLRHFDAIPYVYGRLAKDLPRMKSLSFTTNGDFYRENLLPMEINIFSKLRKLELILYSKFGANLLSVTPFLHSCPLLEEFYLLSFTDSEYNGPQVEMPEVTFHPHLKKVQISGFRGSEIEIDCALYILKCAVALEQMFIFRAYVYARENWFIVGNTLPWSEETRIMIHEKLQGQAISKTAELTIQHELLCKSLSWLGRYSRLVSGKIKLLLF